MNRDPFANPERLIKRIYSYVAYLVGDGPEAEDLTSEAFERMLRYRESYDPAKGPPVAWALGIARRCVAGRGADPSWLDEEALADVPAPSPGIDATDRLTVQAAVARLAPRERELIALRYGADLSARQIGELLNVRPNTVEVSLHRALRRLRAELEPDFRPRPVRREEPAPDGL